MDLQLMSTKRTIDDYNSFDDNVCVIRYLVWLFFSFLFRFVSSTLRVIAFMITRE